MKNYYDILTVHQSSTDQEIKKAYRSLAKEWHPDVNNGPDAHMRFVEISEAYQILINPQTRQEYDRIIFNNNTNTQSQYDFSNAQRTAREKGEYYSSISLERVLEEIFKSVVELGKITLIGEEEFNKSVSLNDLLKLGFKGWFAVVLAILTFTGVLAPITIPLLLKMTLLDKNNRVVGITNVFFGMLLHIPAFIGIVMILGYALDILYLTEEELLGYLVLLFVLTSVGFYIIHSKLTSKNPWGKYIPMGKIKYIHIDRSKLLKVTAIFLLAYIGITLLSWNFNSIYFIGLDPAVLFVAGIVLGPLPAFIVGVAGNFIAGIIYGGYYDISFLHTLLFSLIGIFGSFMTYDKTFSITMGQVNNHHIRRIIKYAGFSILYTTILDFLFISFTYGFYMIEIFFTRLLGNQIINFITIVVVTILFLNIIGKSSKKADSNTTSLTR